MDRNKENESGNEFKSKMTIEYSLMTNECLMVTLSIGFKIVNISVKLLI